MLVFRLDNQAGYFASKNGNHSSGFNNGVFQNFFQAQLFDKFDYNRVAKKPHLTVLSKNPGILEKKNLKNVKF